ncbi:MAG: PIN domain-containing protein [Gammaproteobacteria bacterium]|nr:PIN domain-containing protein [Gammaproteobacteria bacterium]
MTRPPTWQVADLTIAIAHRAARIRSQTRLRLPDATIVATALETSCIALVSHDRDLRALDQSTERIAIYS